MLSEIHALPFLNNLYEYYTFTLFLQKTCPECFTYTPPPKKKRSKSLRDMLHFKLMRFAGEKTWVHRGMFHFCKDFGILHAVSECRPCGLDSDFSGSFHIFKIIFPLLVSPGCIYDLSLKGRVKNLLTNAGPHLQPRAYSIPPTLVRPEYGH